jgi:hypothetical protein
MHVRRLRRVWISVMKTKPTPPRLPRWTPAAWLCLILAIIALVSLTVAMSASVASMGRWMGAVCGEWAPPGWKQDARCDETLEGVREYALTVARFGAAGFCLAAVWVAERRRKRANSNRHQDA